MELERYIKDAADAAMQEYVTSEKYCKEQDSIILLIEELRRSMTPQAAKTLNNLLDKINKDDSSFAYQAFMEGAIWGAHIITEHDHL